MVHICVVFSKENMSLMQICHFVCAVDLAAVSYYKMLLLSLCETFLHSGYIRKSYLRGSEPPDDTLWWTQYLLFECWRKSNQHLQIDQVLALNTE